MAPSKETTTIPAHGWWVRRVTLPSHRGKSRSNEKLNAYREKMYSPKISQRMYHDTEPRNMMPRSRGLRPATRIGSAVSPDAKGRGDGSVVPPRRYVERATEPLRKSIPTMLSKAQTMAAANAMARPKDTDI